MSLNLTKGMEWLYHIQPHPLGPPSTSLLNTPVDKLSLCPFRSHYRLLHLPSGASLTTSKFLV